MSIASNLNDIISNIPEKVKLVAVSKTKPNSDILEAYDAGQRIFGENKVQDLEKKQKELPEDIEWHFIGHLQTNKVKYLASFVSLIHAVDSMKLLKEVNKQAKKNNRTINCLLQIHIAQEESKFGLTKEEAQELINSDEYKSFDNISIIGLMGMATYSPDEEVVRNEFKYLKEIFLDFKANSFLDDENFNEISMGMSGDYEIAIKEGSTMVRVGSSIFGARTYKTS